MHRKIQQRPLHPTSHGVGNCQTGCRGSRCLAHLAIRLVLRTNLWAHEQARNPLPRKSRRNDILGVQYVGASVFSVHAWRGEQLARICRKTLRVQLRNNCPSPTCATTTSRPCARRASIISKGAFESVTIVCTASSPQRKESDLRPNLV